MVQVSKFKTILSSLDKFLSRKLIVWIVATIFFAMTKIDSSEWFGVTMTYLGVEGGADVVTRLKNKKENTIEEKKDG